MPSRAGRIIAKIEEAGFTIIEMLVVMTVFAIISVGRNSMFGHPHKEVVQRWQANGATVVTTGECGTITVTTDGTELSLKKHKPN